MPFFTQNRLKFRPICLPSGILLGEMVVEIAKPAETAKPETAKPSEFEIKRGEEDIDLSRIAPVDVNGIILVESIGNDNFVVVTLNLDKKSVKCLNLKVIDSAGRVLKDHENFKNYDASNCLVCCNNAGLLFLYRSYKRNKRSHESSEISLDSLNYDLYERSCIDELESEILAMTANESQLFTLDENDDLCVYNTRLGLQRTIAMNTKHSCAPFYFPKAAKPSEMCMRAKGKNFYFLDRDHLVIMNSGTGVLVRRFALKKNTDSFGFYADGTIACLASPLLFAASQISFYTQDGTLMTREVDVDMGYSLISESKNHNKLFAVSRSKIKILRVD
jgi:hypothetical protein